MTKPAIFIDGARTHNLKSVRAAIPRGALTVVTGVSGSGKSSLAFDTLYAEGQRRYVESMSTYARQFLERMQRPDVDSIEGVPPAIAIEQRNGVRNARSTVGTVTEISDYLLSILDCLALTVDEALDRFLGEEKLLARLRPFAEVGLGYLQLGQSTATLSGGESQRLKLAAHLTSKSTGATLFLLDEPTTGLHGRDVEMLLAAIARLLGAGHTVVAIEHNLDFIRAADRVIDLGPEGGDAGGRVVAVGTPDELALVHGSHTGRALARRRRAERAQNTISQTSAAATSSTPNTAIT